MLSEKLLLELSDPQIELVPHRLSNLSGLTPDEIVILGETWQRLGVRRRQQIITQLYKMAKDDFDLNFDGVFKFCLEDSDGTVRVKAIEGLWECEDRRIIDPLIHLLNSDPVVTVRAAAGTALGKFLLLGETECLRPADADKIERALLTVIDNPEEPVEIRRRAIESISNQCTEKVSAIIEEAYHSHDLKLKASAIRAMGHNGDPQWLPLLIQELCHDDPEIRYEACQACGELVDPQAVPYLIRLIDDTDLQVQLAAIKSLGDIGGYLAKKALRRHLGDPDRQIRQAVKNALEELQLEEDIFSAKEKPNDQVDHGHRPI